MLLMLLGTHFVLLHLVFHCHRIEGYRLLSGHKRLYVCVLPWLPSCLLVGITFNRCLANWNRLDMPAASFLACFFFLSLVFLPKSVYFLYVCAGGTVKDVMPALVGQVLDVNTGWYGHTHTHKQRFGQQRKHTLPFIHTLVHGCIQGHKIALQREVNK